MSTLLRWMTRTALVLAAACGAPGSAATHAAAPAHDAPAEEARAMAPSDFSVHDLDGVWRDQDGRERTLASLGGRVQVVAMVYTRCTHTCPSIIAEFKAIEAALPAGADVGFVLLSLDPARDTPGRMREFASRTRLDPARWTLLAGDEEQVRDVAALLRIRYRPEAGGEFSHANAYLVLDADGRVVMRRDGLNGGAGEAAAIAALAGARPARAAAEPSTART